MRVLLWALRRSHLPTLVSEVQTIKFALSSIKADVMNKFDLLEFALMAFLPLYIVLHFNKHNFFQDIIMP